MEQIVVLLHSSSNETEKSAALTRSKETFPHIKEKQIIFLCDIWEGDIQPRPENVIKYGDMKRLDIFNSKNPKKHCYLDITNVERGNLGINAMWVAIENLKTLGYKITIFKHWKNGNGEIKVRLEI